jgi:hypothetical protein
MTRALVISVGTGIGIYTDSKESLTHGLVASIEDSNPDKLYYVVTAESSKTTLPILLEEVKGKPYETILLDRIDDIQAIFNQLNPLIKKIREKHSSLYVDYTSGTKAMTGSLAMLAVLHEANRISNITGVRKNGLVQKGTETIQKISPLFATAEIKIKTALEQFNNYQYKAVLLTLDTLKNRTSEHSLNKRINTLELLTNAYSSWDLFNHEEARQFLSQSKIPEASQNKRFLGLMSREDEKTPYYIADLLNNATRRGQDEGKYDDAVARLYRVIELLGHHRLVTEHNLNPSELPVEKLPRTLINRWPEAERTDTLKIGLYKSYELLEELGDSFGRKLKSSSLKGLLSERNSSILAHGLVPVGPETFSKLYQKVLSYSEEAIDNLDLLVEQSEFPKLNDI